MANRNPIHQLRNPLAEAARGRLPADAETMNGSEGELPEEPADAEAAHVVPQGGLNPEVGDMDAETDPDSVPDDDDENGLPGKAGGGLIGG